MHQDHSMDHLNFIMPIKFGTNCTKKLHLQSYLEMLWYKTGYFGQLGNNNILFIILIYIIKQKKFTGLKNGYGNIPLEQ